ncbi:hypothetical protein HPB47_023782 [Ixodes persulcatus]|uniref:Uncharacterized protein n=1 Tax=Ixodes persulcatus TaxID=34615 RepID=A0AC60Q609_IXOPE|nr:hypothetical protein HPB47_023782 [Ixodes persulcatus]
MVSGESASADAHEAAAWLQKKMTGILMRYQPADVYKTKRDSSTKCSRTGRWLSKETAAAEENKAGCGSEGSVCLVLDNCSDHHIEDLELTNVTAKKVIKNCFRKAGFETPAASAPEEVDSGGNKRMCFVLLYHSQKK